MEIRTRPAWTVLLILVIWLGVGCGEDEKPPVAPHEPVGYLVHPDGTGDHPTIQAAVNASADGDTISLADGTYKGDGNRDIDFKGKAIIVRSQSGNPGSCVIDCAGDSLNQHRGFIFQSGEGPGSVLQDLTITGGVRASGGAVAISGEGASPVIRGCRFIGNSAIAPDFGWGGALSCYTFGEPASSRPMLINCYFASNEAAIGGAICCVKGLASFSECTFVSNAADMWASAVACGGGCTTTLTSCTFVGNVADEVSACVVGCSDGAATELVNCLLALNGSNAASCDPMWPCSMVLNCCNVFGNAGGDWVGCIEDQLGQNGNISTDPLFCDPENGDFRLQPGSPCSPDSSECGLIGAWGVGCE